MTEDIHQVQASILKELLFNNGTNFAELNKTELGSDHFTFHVKKLVIDGYITKEKDKYFLTTEGKVLAGKLDTDSLKIEKFGKVGVMIIGIKEEKGKKYYLMQERLKEPFYGYWGFMTGKVRYGDKPKDTAIRELKEECGLTGKPTFLGSYHKLRGPNPQSITLDNYFHIYTFKNPKGTLIDTKEGRNLWLPEKELKKLKMFDDINNILKLVKSKNPKPFIENFYKVDKI